MEQSMRDQVLPDERLDRLPDRVPEEIWMTVAFAFCIAIVTTLGTALVIHNILR